ncbi:MAG TPA: hypothetical protein ENK28_05230 [Aliiroseovarius sp.]|nr:hypothetical protein [Aliiroseovarius sp.]
MTLLSPEDQKIMARERVARAFLLLSSPCPTDVDELAATFLAAIGETAGTLTSARKFKAQNKLILTTTTARVMVSSSRTPLGAEHFDKAVPPFAKSHDRAAMLNIISHHEAFLGLKLRFHSDPRRSVSLTLHRAMAALAGQTATMAALWGPTGRLHHGDGFQSILQSRLPMELFLAPRFHTTGPRKLPVLDFDGMRNIAGFRLRLHVIDIERENAVQTGLDFARACFADQTLPQQKSFLFQDRVFRLAHAPGTPDVTLIPLPEAQNAAIAQVRTA